MRILFVCTGNTCRSPIAEAIARREVIARGWLDVEVESAGTDAHPGSPASDGSLLVGLEHGLDLGAHESRQLTPDIARGADVTLVMGPSHLAVARSMGADAASLLTTYADPGTSPRGVPDPFGGDLPAYRETYREIERLVASTFDRLALARPRREL